MGKYITLNAVAFTVDPNQQSYSNMIKDFNKYSLENNINIEIKLNLVSSDNSTSIVTDYGSMIESVIKKSKNNKYHIYFYDNVYTYLYGPHLLDLYNYISKDHIDLYESKIIDYTCKYKEKLVGLVWNYIIYI